MRTVCSLLVLLALAGCGGDGDARQEEPGEFAQRVVRQLAEGDAGAAWEELHPDHQESVPRRLYTRCEGQDGLGELDGLEVTGVREEPAVVPGSGEQPSTEVSLAFDLDGEPVSLDMHVFDVDGEWRWVIGAPDWAAYAAGSCPPGDA